MPLVFLPHLTDGSLIQLGSYQNELHAALFLDKHKLVMHNQPGIQKL
jgi:hypothetical protein